MGFGDMLSKLFKKEGEKEAKSVEENPKTENIEKFQTRSEEGIEKNNNTTPQMTESRQKEEVQLEEEENVETEQEAKTEEHVLSSSTRPTAGSVEGPASATEQITEEKILEVLSDVYDPEIPIDIVNLGLIYGVDIQDGNVHVKMTMTAPGCPSSAQIAAESQMLIEGLRGVKEATIEIVWDPPWDPSRMSEDAKRGLGYI